jgi:SagB-type dehydrogenase family enzyme
VTDRSRRAVVVLAVVAALSVLVDLAFGGVGLLRRDEGGRWRDDEALALPAPATADDRSVAAALAGRRSRREYGDDPLSLADLGQVLWAAQGVTDRGSGHRAAPSAGAHYPLETYVVVGVTGVEGVDAGVYRYRPARHDLVPGPPGDARETLRAAAFDQRPVGEAPVSLVLCAVDERTTAEYGARGRRRYVPMEAGHAAENVYLQAESLGLATVAVGAFDDDRVRAAVGAPGDQRPLYVLPVGPRA